MKQRTIRTEVDQARFRVPIRISGRIIPGLPAVRVTIAEGGIEGRGEAGGVFYLGDDVDHMLGEIERVRASLSEGADRHILRTLLPPGGARNALDAALWELEARRAGAPVWRLAGLPRPRPLITTYTLGAEDPAAVEQMLAGYADARALKLKLDGDVDADIARLRTVHARRPDAWLMADANQGYDRNGLERLLPILIETGVRLLEQPVARGQEAQLDGFNTTIPLAADESVLGLDELVSLPGCFQVANIKLDKCGGLTEALEMVAQARRSGLGVMVGNMGGTSIAAAPAFLLAQLADHVDLDGPKFLIRDVPNGALYEDGRISFQEDFWGWKAGNSVGLSAATVDLISKG